MADSAYKEVVSFKLAAGNDVTKFSLVDAATEEYRFLHIPSLLDSDVLKIVTTEKELPVGNYACISYVWGGLTADEKAPKTGSIFVQGLRDGDNTPVSMLKMMCTIARKQGMNLIWMDKLCIRQDTPNENKKSIGWKDKNWQMVRMYEIYHRCKVCLAAPGGMNRLPNINERTTWIDRAWTLQEALAPENVQILFNWTEGRKNLQHISSVEVEQVLDGVGASPLRGLLEASLRPTVQVLDPEDDGTKEPQEIEVNVLINRGEVTNPVLALLGALDHGDQDGRINAVWRCILMRQAKYREDMVFSIMGIMETPVEGEDHDKDSPNYKEEPATYNLLIKFLQKMTANGSTAEWLGAAPQLGPAVTHSGLPALALRSNVTDDPYSGFEIVKATTYSWVRPKMTADRGGNDSWWWLKDCSAVKVFDSGDIEISSKAIPVEESADKTEYKDYILQRDDPSRLIHCITHRAWNIKDGAKNAVAYAVFIGTKLQYTDGNLPVGIDPNSTMLMLVKKVEGGKFRNVGYTWGDEDIAKKWKDVSFVIA